MFLYGLLRQSLPNHAHLGRVCRMGDFAKLFNMARAIAVKDDAEVMMDAARAMANLRKDASVSWSKQSAQVTEIYLPSSQALSSGTCRWGINCCRTFC